MSGEGAMAKLAELKVRADEDAMVDSDTSSREAVPHDPHRHRADLDELGLRVSLTRSRYPNTRTGVEQYAITVSRIDMASAPDGREVAMVLSTFGDAAEQAVERRGGSLVRMFRVPVLGQEAVRSD